MTIHEALGSITTILVPADAPPVFAAAAELLADAIGAEVRAGGVAPGTGRPEAGVFAVLPGSGGQGGRKELEGLKGREGQRSPEGQEGREDQGEWESSGVYLQLTSDGAGSMRPSHDRYLYGFTRWLLQQSGIREVAELAAGKTFRPAFRWQRSVYDFFLAQEGRIQTGLDREACLRRLAGSGGTHVEVNALAYPMGLETGPKGEIYPMFYTYCPALDQFVSSELNDGLYPRWYLEANLARLKENARLAVRYGLEPGLLCFEPRSVPERFFERYPMLRGARVDHPFRSFQPRFNLTITHPLVRDHYADLVRRLLREVPELAYLAVWTNDSGAGFEYTRSLYVGRNGGAYLIREWKDDDEIARAAGENAVRFLRVLCEAGRELNPDFRVLTRLESFYGEHETVWAGLADGLEVETASLVARGWEMPYHHPRYPDIHAVNGGSIYQAGFDAGEQDLMRELAGRGSRAHFYFAVGPNTLFAPLLGIPYPTLTHARLKLLYDGGVRYLAHPGGFNPPGLVPWNPNHEIVLAFQFDPGLDIGAEVERLAAAWAGEELAGILGRAWDLTEKAILAFPVVTPLYATFGFVWYRLWARPLVPDIEAIPEAERAYYQNYMCTTPHNPNNVDLSRDVLFTLAEPEVCRRAVERIDANLREPIDAAVELLDRARARSQELLGGDNVIEDQYVRISALRCWFETQRNVAAWIAGVYGYLAAGRAGDERARKENRALLREMGEREIENSRRLLALLETGVEFMATTDLGETPLIHGRNLRDLIEQRIALMTAHADDEPRLDPDYMMRRAGELL